MAVYFDHRLEVDSLDTPGEVFWHPTQDILAVTTVNSTGEGQVSIFIDEGEQILGVPLKRPCQATAAAWHPTRKVLAVGWENGEILVWNVDAKEMYESTHIHKAALSIIHWSSNGTRLATGDTFGALIVWKSDAKGHLQGDPISQHQLQELITQVVFKPAPPSNPGLDIHQLARAAISGDESALDMFTWKKGPNNNMYGPTEALTFFIGGVNGGVFFVNEAGKCVQSFTVDSPVKKLLYYAEKNILVTVTNNLMLTQHAVMPEGDANEIIKVKLSGMTENPVIIWAGKGLLATATGEGIIRMWDLNKEENYTLTFESHGENHGETITCVAYSSHKGILAGGTNQGTVLMWKFDSALSLINRRQDLEKNWEIQAATSIEGGVCQLAWSSGKHLLAAKTSNLVYILSEQVMNTSYHDETAVVQVGPSHLAIDIFSTGNHHDLKTDIHIKGVVTTKEVLAVWNGKQALIYEYAADKSVIRSSGSFAAESLIFALFEQSVYTIEKGKVQVRTLQGTIKQLLTISEADGEPVSLDICGHFLVIGTIRGVIRLFDLSRREAKAHNNPKYLMDLVPDFGTLVSAKCNSVGTRVSVIVRKANETIDPKLYIWDLELDTVQYFNFETGFGEQDDFQGTNEDQDQSDVERCLKHAAQEIAGRYPLSHYWDAQEPKLVVCEVKLLVRQVEIMKRSISTSSTIIMERPPDAMIVSLFSSPDNGILTQDTFALSDQCISLMGVQVPFNYFVKKSDQSIDADEETEMINNTVDEGAVSTSFQKMVLRKTMRDFIGLENSDKTTQTAMMNFSYYLAIANMDEAFKAIKLIKSESVWENMAKMCVKSRRLDVAKVCLGNMRHARGAKALRDIAKEPEIDAKVAVLAMQLGLTEDAERLLKNCKRYDLLNDFYQDCGNWGKAMETAEMYDRIHLRTTYYNYGKHLEAKGDINGAVPNYEKSDTHRFEVPRMLFEDPASLQSYIVRSKDKVLHKWWAQYLESSSEMDAAVQFYEAAQDYLSLVRVYCYCGSIEKAADICNETGDRAACYHLARQYENQDMIKEAIHLFTRAQAYGNAIRLCKEHGFDDQMMNLALLGRPEDMTEAARYYESRPGMQDKAVMLYHKAGNFSKALDLSFKTKQYGALQLVSGDLDEKADPEVLQRCADFFIENEQYDKAVDLLAIAKKYWEALKICMDQHVVVTEDLAEKLTPAKDGDQERTRIVEAIAELCMHQGQYHLATKKFTQSGNKMKAMKALLKSGDTEKITFFAGVSRQKEIYVMAANYLQSLDWRRDPEIMKHIITFYTRGRALESLAAFYDCCAQVEIDEYQNYEKALGALNEAYKCMSKATSKDEGSQEQKLLQIKHKMMLIKKFASAKRVYSDDPEEAIKQCQILLEEQDLDESVRIGDVYGFVIEHYTSKERWKAALSCLDEMQKKVSSTNITYYVKLRTIHMIYQSLGMAIPAAFNVEPRDSPQDLDDGEIVEEEIYNN